MNLPLNNTAASIAASALFELFPGIELLGGSLTSIGFAYGFRSAHRLPPEAENLIEERMRQIVREKRPIQTFEMVPFSAREFLLKEGLSSRADRLRLDGGGLVEIVQIGSFIDLSPGPHLLNSAQLAAFKLWPIRDAGGGELSLTGCALPSKDELKQFLKRLRAYPEKSHMEVGKALGYWRLLDGRFIWLSPGLKRKRELIETLRQQWLFVGALEVAFPDRETAPSLQPALDTEMGNLLAEVYEEPRTPWDPETGLLAGEGGTQIRIRCFSSPEALREKLISSLQMTGRTLNILGFEHRLRLRGRKRSDRDVQTLLEALQEEEVELELTGEKCTPQLEFLVEDNLGRQWAAFSIDLLIEKAVNEFLVKASVERLVALLLERSLSGTD